MHLTDSFAELFAYVVTFRKTAEQTQPAYETFRAEVVRLLKKSEESSAKTVSGEEYDQARYALCAWIDETVMSVGWNFRNRWRPESLQKIYYGSTEAGQKFFEKLNKLGVLQKRVREIYYLCLAFGFKGRYCNPEDKIDLEQLKDHHLKLIFDGAVESPSLASFEQNMLFPEAYPAAASAPAEKKADPQRKMFWLSVLGGPLAFFFLLFLIYRFTLYSLGENILRAIRAS